MVAQRWKDLAKEMVAYEDSERILAKLREECKTDVKKLKNSRDKVMQAFYEMGVYHSEYQSQIDDWRQKLVSAGELRRVQRLAEFECLDLKRKLEVQAKIRYSDDPRFEHEPQLLFEDHEDQAFIRDKLDILPGYIEEFKLSYAETRALSEYHRQRMTARGSNIVVYRSADWLIETARRWLTWSSDPCELAVALAVTTGRRPVEILKTGFFTLPESQDNYRLCFGGQVKTGIRGIHSLNREEDSTPPYLIPVLAPRKTIITALARLRSVWDTSGMTKTQATQKHSGALNGFVRKEIDRNMRFQDLRALYMKMAYELTKPHDYGINEYAKRVLGHLGVEMSTHYTRIEVEGLTKRYRRPDGMQFVL